MLNRLETEGANPASQGIDSRSTEDILKIMNAEDRRVAGAVQAEIPQIARAVDGIVDRVRAGGRLFYIGAGTSGRLGVLDASECPPTFQVPPELVQGVIAGGEPALSRSTEASEDSPEMGAQDLESRGFTGSDALVGITASGRTPYVLGAVKAAQSMGAFTVGVSSNPDTELSGEVDVSIAPRTGPEIIAGLDTPQGRNSRQTGFEYDLDGRDDSARSCIREPDGERPTNEQQARRPGAADC